MQGFFLEQSLNQVEAQFEAVGFLGVDAHIDAVLRRLQAQFQQFRVQLVYHLFVFFRPVERVQGR